MQAYMSPCMHGECAEVATITMQTCEKAMDLQLDVCKALRDQPMEEATLNQVRLELRNKMQAHLPSHAHACIHEPVHAGHRRALFPGGPLRGGRVPCKGGRLVGLGAAAQALRGDASDPPAGGSAWRAGVALVVCSTWAPSKSCIVFLLLAHPSPDHACTPQIKLKNLQPAMDWAEQHQDKNKAPLVFKFKLQSLNFLTVLMESGEAGEGRGRGGGVFISHPCSIRSPRLSFAAIPSVTCSLFLHTNPAIPHVLKPAPSGRRAALEYAKQHFQRYQEDFMRDIQRLMGCMLYYDKPLGETEYR